MILRPVETAGCSRVAERTWAAISICRTSCSPQSLPTKRSSGRSPACSPVRCSIAARTCSAVCCESPRAGSGRRRRSSRGRTRRARARWPSAYRAFARVPRRFAEGFEEARQALFGTAVLGREASVVAFEDLGAHKYLLRIASDSGVRDATIEAVGRIADYDRERGASLLADARGVPATAGEHRRDLGGAVHPCEHASPAASPDRRPLRDRPPSRRLADGRDRREARSAQAGARSPVDAIPIFARPTMEALAIVRARRE